MVTLVGQSRQIKEVRDLIEKVAPLDIQVLVTGETGTGKDVVARMIHEKSHRNKGPFVPVNCGAIPDSLMESALFGHEKGAFTGATGRTKGFFEEAFGGTLFLDEISEGSLAFQTALLRVLQEEIFFKIGSTLQQKGRLQDCCSNQQGSQVAGEQGGLQGRPLLQAQYFRDKNASFKRQD